MGQGLPPPPCQSKVKALTRERDRQLHNTRATVDCLRLAVFKLLWLRLIKAALRCAFGRLHKPRRKQQRTTARQATRHKNANEASSFSCQRQLQMSTHTHTHTSNPFICICVCERLRNVKVALNCSLTLSMDLHATLLSCLHTHTDIHFKQIYTLTYTYKHTLFYTHILLQTVPRSRQRQRCK